MFTDKNTSAPSCTNLKRRKLAQTIVTGLAFIGLPGIANAAGEILKAMMSERPKEAFSQESVGNTLEILFGTKEIPASEHVRVIAAELAENGAVVPVKVETDFASARSITLIATKNPVPLVAQFMFNERVVPFVATRVKLAESSDVIAVIDTPEGLFKAHRHVEVTIGGCSA